MTALHTPDRWEAIVDAVTESMREPIKEAVKEAIREVEAEDAGAGGSRSRTRGQRGVAGSASLLAIGVALGYVLRSWASMDEFESLEGTKTHLAEAVQEGQEQLSEAENIEEVEITGGEDEDEDADGDAETDGGSVLSKLLIVVGMAVLGYALKSQSGRITDASIDDALESEPGPEPEAPDPGAVADEPPEPPADDVGTDADEGIEDIGIETGTGTGAGTDEDDESP